MERVVVEREFGEPAEFAEVQAREDAVASCAHAYRVSFLRSYQSRDKRRMVCLYEAPDTEAVRVLQRTSGLPAQHTYAVHKVMDEVPEQPPRGYSLVVAQRNLAEVEGLSLELVKHVASDPNGCYKRLRVNHFGAYLARDLSRMVCVYYTPDLESVRQGNREYGTPWEHLWAGEQHPAGA